MQPPALIDTATPQSTPIACNLGAIPKSERPRYRELTRKLRQSIQGRTELPNGYQYALDGHSLGLAQLGSWIALERRCCPFLSFHLTVPAAANSPWLLTLTGPTGTKLLLAEEFPLPSHP